MAFDRIAAVSELIVRSPPRAVAGWDKGEAYLSDAAKPLPNVCILIAICFSNPKGGRIRGHGPSLPTTPVEWASSMIIWEFPGRGTTSWTTSTDLCQGRDISIHAIDSFHSHEDAARTLLDQRLVSPKRNKDLSKRIGGRCVGRGICVVARTALHPPRGHLRE